MSRQEPRHVTDHALVRYLERVKGFDLDPHRAAIRTVTDKAEGCARAIIHDGFRYELGAGGAVTTVTPTSERPSLTRQRKLMDGARA